MSGAVAVAEGVARMRGGCDDSRTLVLALEVGLATGDGALVGSLVHELHVVPDGAGSDLLTSGARARTSEFTLADFDGTLDLGVDPVTRAAVGWLSLRVVRGDLRGELGFWYDAGFPEGHVYEGAGITPLRARFPADGCAIGEQPVPLDAPRPELGGRAPDEVLERARTALADVTLAGEWREGPLEPAIGDPVSLMLGVGTPTREDACLQSNGVHVPATVELVSADGKIALAGFEAAWLFGPNPDGGRAALMPDEGRVRLESDWIPTADFKAVAGISGVNFGSGEYGRFQMRSKFNMAGQTAVGELDLDVERDRDPQAASYPRLPRLFW